MPHLRGRGRAVLSNNGAWLQHQCDEMLEAGGHWVAAERKGKRKFSSGSSAHSYVPRTPMHQLRTILFQH